MDWQQVERLIKVRREEITRALQQAALDSPNDEATFRNKVSRILHDFCELVGIRFETKDEYRLDSGIADAVSDRLVLEYKAPGFLQGSKDAKPNRRAVEKIQGYIEDIAKREQRDVQKMAGVILDGRYFIFVRRFERGWQDDLVRVNNPSTEQLLRLLAFTSSGIALTPENLVRDFGIEQPRTQCFVQSLEASLSDTQDPLVGKLFEQWRTFFSQAIEYKEAFSGIKLKELGDLAQKIGVDPHKPETFLYAIHTYYALLVKLIAWLVLSRYKGAKLGAPVFASLATASPDELKKELNGMERGGIFRDFHCIRNLLEGDFFSWYLNAWNDRIEITLRELIQKLNDYDPTTLKADPKISRDLLKKLYHYIMPRTIRHNLGEYYTPDWLAQRLLNQVDIGFFRDDPAKSSYLRNNLLKLRFLDPACGSGTFLVLIITRIREVGKQLQFPEGAILEAILNNVVGIDLNPLAVITARTNYILALAELLDSPGREDIDIPVYLADSIVTPSKGEGFWGRGKYRLLTSVGEFWVPEEVISKQRFDALCELLDSGVRDEIETDTFLERCRFHLKLEDEAFGRTKDSLAELYQKIYGFHQNRFNGIWARILRNGFAPLFIGRFDYIVGNPPWVNWENLPDTYRDREEVRSLWQFHGLFPHGGMDTILGKGKKDISVLMTYEAIHRYLKDGGRLGFVITQSVFKTAGAGQGFRRFMLGDSTPIKVWHVDDMVELNPFEGAANRTSVVILEKGRATTYPVDYTYWKKTAKGKSIGFDSELADVMAMVKRMDFKAEPVDAKDKTSAWLTGQPLAIKAIRKVLGKSDYEAHAGVYSGGANAVYWLDVIEKLPDGLVKVVNITEGQKRKVDKTPFVIEEDLVYPLLRGRDVKRWRAEPSAWILMVQDPVKRRGIDEKELQLRYLKTWSYLKRFETVLRERKSRGVSDMVKEGAPFYSMFAVGAYTFAPYKVVWPWISIGVRGAVVSSWQEKPILPEHNTSFVDCKQKAEAYFICGLLNSAIGDLSIRAYYSGGGGGIASPHVLENIRIPKFDPQSPLHLRLAELSQNAHALARANNVKALSEVEEELDSLAAKLWDITPKELKLIKQSLVGIS